MTLKDPAIESRLINNFMNLDWNPEEKLKKRWLDRVCYVSAMRMNLLYLKESSEILGLVQNVLNKQEIA